MQTQRKAGRKLSPFILPVGWREEIWALYGKGASDLEVRIWIRKVRGTFSQHLWNRWLRDEYEFRDAIEQGRELAQAWWMELGRIYITNEYRGDRLNNKLYYWTMRNRFGWR